MDKLNASFEKALIDRGISLKVIPSDSQITYHGRLQLDDGRLVSFALQLPKSDDEVIVQLVFDKLANCQTDIQRVAGLELVNQLNVTTGVYYYFGLQDNGEVFARYMLPVQPEKADKLLDILQIGARLVRQVAPKLAELNALSK